MEYRLLSSFIFGFVSDLLSDIGFGLSRFFYSGEICIKNICLSQFASFEISIFTNKLHKCFFRQQHLCFSFMNR